MNWRRLLLWLGLGCLILGAIGFGAQKLIWSDDDQDSTDAVAEARAIYVSRGNAICTEATRERQRQERRLSGRNSSVAIVTIGDDNPLAALMQLRRPPAIKQELDELFQSVDRVREAALSGVEVESLGSHADRVALRQSLKDAQAAAAAASQAISDYGLTACPKAIGWPKPRGS